MLVEAVGFEFFFSLNNRELLGSRELQEESLNLAVRAVALEHGLRKIDLCLVTDIPAVARASVFFHTSYVARITGIPKSLQIFRPV